MPLTPVPPTSVLATDDAPRRTFVDDTVGAPSHERITTAPVFPAEIPAPFLLTTAVLHGSEARETEPHRHREGMLIWIARGSARVCLDGSLRTLTIGDGLWLPPLTPHSVQQDDASTSCFTYFAPALSPKWSEVASVELSAAFRELLLHLAHTPMPTEHRLRAQRVVRELLPDEPRSTGTVPMPFDARVQPLVLAVLADPADDRSAEDWAWHLALSTRTLSRIFSSDIGISFSQWRTAVRMSAATRMLAQCVPVNVVAHRVGYTTTSSFSAAFRRSTGARPSDLGRKRGRAA